MEIVCLIQSLTLSSSKIILCTWILYTNRASSTSSPNSRSNQLLFFQVMNKDFKLDN